MKGNQDKEKIYYIFSETKKDFNLQIEKAFEMYLKDLLNTEILNLEKNTKKD